MESNKKSEWEEVTTFSRGDKERIPRIWELNADKLTITVHRHIHYLEDQWLLTCRPFYDCFELQCEDIDDAKFEALNIMLCELRHVYDAIYEEI